MTIQGETYIRHRILVGVVQDVVQDVHGRLGLDSNSGADTEAVDVLDELFRAGLLVAGGFGRLGVGGIDGSLVVEAVQVAAGLLELLDPFFGYWSPSVDVYLLVFPSSSPSSRNQHLSNPYLGDHHVAVEGAFSIGFSGPVDVRADLGDDRGAKGDVGHKVAVHDVDV